VAATKDPKTARDATKALSTGVRYLRAVLVEDDPLARRYLREVLYDVSTQIEVRECATLENAVRYLERGSVDVVLLDLNLPDSEGDETFAFLHSRFPHIPIVIATGDNRLETAFRLVERGAADYVLKSEQPISIVRRVLLAVERWRHTVPASRRASDEYRQLEAAQAELKTAHSSGQHIAVTAAKERREDALVTVIQTTLGEMLNVKTELQRFVGDVDQLRTMVQDHERTLQGDSERPPLQHQVKLLTESVEKYRVRIDSVTEEVKEVQRDSAVLEVQREADQQLSEARHRYSTEHWKFWQKVVAGIVAIVIAIISGYFTVRQTGKLLKETSSPAP
jgi:DNA-binding NarL/FixJ family response regulator